MAQALAVERAWGRGRGAPVGCAKSGAPAKFGAEQICAIIAIACEPPSASDRPITQWSQQEVADEAMRRGIVDSISQRSVGRFFKRVGVEAASHPVLADVQAG